MRQKLTEDNFKDFAIESYSNLHCLSVDEFRSDFIKLIRINRSIETYLSNPDKGQSVRSLLNIFISLLNVFDHKSLVRLVFFQLKDQNIPVAKSIFEFLNLLPKTIPEVELKKYKYDQDLYAKLEAL